MRWSIASPTTIETRRRRIPGRGFTGRDQVRENWQRIFAGVPDITADVLGYGSRRGHDLVRMGDARHPTRRPAASHARCDHLRRASTTRRAGRASISNRSTRARAASGPPSAPSWTPARDRRGARRPPSRRVIRVLNPILRVVLRTPLGRLVKPFALLEFKGRHSGRPYRVPAGWHDADGVRVVLTPAHWRANFSPSAPAVVHYRGHARHMTGTLVRDPAEVARYVGVVLAGGTGPRQIGLRVPSGHTITAADVVQVDRQIIRFEA